MRVTIKYLSLLISATSLGVDGSQLLRGSRRRLQDDVFNVAIYHEPFEPSQTMRRVQSTTNSLHNDYVTACSTYLMSADVTEDGIISQHDFVDFLLNQCRFEEICPKKMKLNFEKLDVNVQMKFIRGICYQEDFVDRSRCIYDLHEMWLDKNMFGFRTGEDEDIQSLVQNMCSDIYSDIGQLGLTRTAEPTSNPSTSVRPSMSPTSNPTASKVPSTFPTSNPSFSLIPSTFPSYSPITSAPALTEEPSSEPTTTASTHSSESSSPSSVQSGSVLPPDQSEVDVDTTEPPFNTPHDHHGDSLSRDVVIVAAALALTMIVLGSIYTMYNHPPRSVITKKTSSNAIHDQWDTTMSSVPLACLGLNQSMSSSSCSHRDQRFVNVYSAEGSPIPQFNPNFASTIVIGTVTIGGSSSYSSGFLGEPDFSPRELSAEQGNAFSGALEYEAVSSLQSNRSFSLVQQRKGPMYMHRYAKKQTCSQGGDPDPSLSPRSAHSCKTVPMTLSCGKKKVHTRELSGDSNIVSLGDWKAVSYMSSDLQRQLPQPMEMNNCGIHKSATDAAASMNQKKFFFDLFTVESELEKGSSHSLPAIPKRQFSFSSSDGGVSSVLSESFFKNDSSYIQRQPVAMSLKSSASSDNVIDSTPSDIFVPWRKEGRSREIEMSDSNRSESDSESQIALPRKRKGLFATKGLFFNAFKRKATRKFTFRNRPYQHLRVELHEDQSVVSMSNTYSSHTDLIVQQAPTPTKPPNDALLGTFAAAILPFRGEDLESPLQAGSEPILGARATSSACDIDQGRSEAQENVMTPKGKHDGGKSDGESALKSDSASAFSRSQFDLSKGWSSCSKLSSSRSCSRDDESNSSESQWHNADFDSIFDLDLTESLEVSKSLEASTEEVSKPSLSETEMELIHDLITARDVSELEVSSPSDESGHSSRSLPHIVSESSDDMSCPSDEMSSRSFDKMSCPDDVPVVKDRCLQKVDDCATVQIVPGDYKEEDFSDEPSTSNEVVATE